MTILVFIYMNNNVYNYTLFFQNFSLPVTGESHITMLIIRIYCVYKHCLFLFHGPVFLQSLN